MVGEHLIKDCVKLAKKKSWDKQKDTEVGRWYKNKLRDAMQMGNITLNEASFSRVPGKTYSVEQTEQLIGNLQLDEADCLDRFLDQVMDDEVCQGHVIKYKVIVNGMPVDTLYDTGVSMSCMAKMFFDTLTVKPK